jgi:hypothetical protein
MKTKYTLFFEFKGIACWRQQSRQRYAEHAPAPHHEPDSIRVNHQSHAKYERTITDDNCIPEEHWIEYYEAHLTRQPQAVFTGEVEAAGTERVISTVSDGQVSVARKPGWTFDRLSGGNCGMAVEVLRKVGLFDDDPCIIRFGEDGEWAYRVLGTGRERVELCG